LKQIIDKLVNALYPPKCPICEKVTADRKLKFCADCYNKLHIIEEPVCVVCGKPISRLEARCADCEKQRHVFDGGRITFSYEQISDSVYRFKYMNRPEYAVSYAEVISKQQQDWLDVISPDLIIPVPLHKKRLIKRGYNQAEELANAISLYTKIPVNTTIVKRVKNTAPLKYSGRGERQNNMKGTFIVCENVVKLTTVVLVDDIFTTGSTLDSVAAELKSHGVKRIYFLTITAAGT